MVINHLLTGMTLQVSLPQETLWFHLRYTYFAAEGFTPGRFEPFMSEGLLELDISWWKVGWVQKNILVV